MGRRLLLLTAGYRRRQLRLQPWHYLHKVIGQLAGAYEVVVVTDGGTPPRGFPSPERIAGIPVYRLPTVGNPRWHPNRTLERVVRALEPDVVLWHLGLSSLLHQQFRLAHPAPVVGIFTSPLYTWRELTRPGLRRLIGGYRLSFTHLLNTLTPEWVHHRAQCAPFRRIVVQTAVTRRQLLHRALWIDKTTVIAPGVDQLWRQPQPNHALHVRSELGYGAADILILYFGSPAPLRGLHTLLHAFTAAVSKNARLKLLVLSRGRQGEYGREDQALRRLVAGQEVRARARVIRGFLPRERLVALVQASDIVALPFELLPSDAPLSVLEARALRKVIVTSELACLPELAGAPNCFLARPGDPSSLAAQLLSAATAVAAGIVPHEAPGDDVRSWQEVGEEWTQLLKNV